jgi:Resolvase, N terminal domain
VRVPTAGDVSVHIAPCTPGVDTETCCLVPLTIVAQPASMILGTSLNATVGYALVSSAGQDLGGQLEKLKGCDKVFKEKRSGVDAGRPELKRCLEYLREGDTLLVRQDGHDELAGARAGVDGGIVDDQRLRPCPSPGPQASWRCCRTGD